MAKITWFLRIIFVLNFVAVAYSNDFVVFKNYFAEKGYSNKEIVNMYKNMTNEEKSVLLPMIYAKRDGKKEAYAILKSEYENMTGVVLKNKVFTDRWIIKGTYDVPDYKSKITVSVNDYIEGLKFRINTGRVYVYNVVLKTKIGNKKIKVEKMYYGPVTIPNDFGQKVYVKSLECELTDQGSGSKITLWVNKKTEINNGGSTNNNGNDHNISYYAKLYNGKIIKGSSNTLYLVENYKKRMFPDKETFYKMGYSDSQIITVSDRILKTIPDGNPIPVINDYNDGNYDDSGYYNGNNGYNDDGYSGYDNGNYSGQNQTFTIELSQRAFDVNARVGNVFFKIKRGYVYVRSITVYTNNSRKPYYLRRYMRRGATYSLNLRGEFVKRIYIDCDVYERTYIEITLDSQNGGSLNDIDPYNAYITHKKAYSPSEAYSMYSDRPIIEKGSELGNIVITRLRDKLRQGTSDAYKREALRALIRGNYVIRKMDKNTIVVVWW
jgi:hypothetical protein